MFSYWAKPEDCLDLCQILNDHVAACVRENPKRFIGEYVSDRCLEHFCCGSRFEPTALWLTPCIRVGLGTLPMQSPELAVQELRRCVQELGLAGIEVLLVVSP